MKQLNISDETYELIKDQLSGIEKVEINSYEDLMGKSVFIRTVTYHFIGKIDKIVGTFFVMSDVTWVADSGRFMNCIKNGELNEAEPIGDWCVNFNTITDFGIWKHSLKVGQK